MQHMEQVQRAHIDEVKDMELASVQAQEDKLNEVPHANHCACDTHTSAELLLIKHAHTGECNLAEGLCLPIVSPSPIEHLWPGLAA